MFQWHDVLPLKQPTI